MAPKNRPVGTKALHSAHTTTTNVVSVVCASAGARACAREAGTLVDEIRKLPKTEQKKVLDSLLADSMLTAKDVKDRDLAMWASALHSALERVVGPGVAGVVGVVPLQRLLAASSGWADVKGFVESSGISKLSVSDRQAAYNLLGELLARRTKEVARAVSAPVSAKFAMNLAYEVPGLFEAAFPGYASAGLVCVVLRKPLSPELPRSS